MSNPARDSAGRFRKGCRGGPGRPRGIDFRKVIETEAKEREVSLTEALWDLFEAQLGKAREGDTAAARFVVAHVCDPDAGSSRAPLDFAAIVAASRRHTQEG